MREKILKDIVTAMKEKDKETLSVLRMVKGAMQMEELDKKKELDDTEMTLLLGKQIKTRKDSVKEFEKAGRTDLSEKTNEEIKILDKYMPVQMTDEEINKKLDKIFEEVKPVGMKDLGNVMKNLSSLKGKADMALVNKLVKERLS
jgi:Uncharacterized conserved protein